MGIPKLFRIISKNYAKIIHRTRPDRSKVEWLGIDFNSLMHPICAQIASSNEKINYKKQENWEELFRGIMDYLNIVIRNLSTTDDLKEIFIAIDGVVPMAKIHQQRQRRFRTAFERYKKYKNWDSCLISPGTHFMTKFESYLKDNLPKLPQITISNSRQFGEGEHKIMNRIRKLPKETNIAIYGLDADLIILGISALTSHSNVHLYRENVHCAIREYEKDAYLLVNIEELWNTIRQEILDSMGKHQKTMKESGLEPTIFDVDNDRLINDFILLSCYFGNDFLPTIPAVSLSLEDSVWYILNNYSRTLAEEGSYMCQSVTDTVFYWNQPFLLKFWNLCSIKEDHRMKLRTQQWLRRRRAPSTEADTINPLEVFYSFPKKKQIWMRNALSSAKSYLSVFNSEDPIFNYTNSTVQNAMLKEWLRGSIWVLSYYRGIKVDPYWFYPWQAPPTFQMMIEKHHDVIKETTQVQTVSTYLSPHRRKKSPKPSLAFQQMVIIPPDSEYCVSKKRLGWFKSTHPRNLYTPSYHEIGNLKYSVIWASWGHECHPYIPLIELPYVIHCGV